MKKVQQKKTTSTKAKTKTKTNGVTRHLTAEQAASIKNDLMSELRGAAVHGVPEEIDWVAKRASYEAQVAAEAAALTPTVYGANATPSLFSVIAQGMGTSEDGSADAFAEGALRTLGDDLTALHAAITDDRGSMVDHKLSLDKLPIMIWRLGERAHAVVEVLTRMADVERSKLEAAEQAKAVAS